MHETKRLKADEMMLLRIMRASGFFVHLPQRRWPKDLSWAPKPFSTSIGAHFLLLIWLLAASGESNRDTNKILIIMVMNRIAPIDRN